MAAKKKPTKKGGAAATSAANKTKARTRTVKGGKPTSGSPKVSSRPRKRAEEEIWMLKHSIDVYYDGAYWIDADNKFVYVNDAGCKALGYTREELIGTTIYEVNPKVNAERMKEVWALLRQGRSFSAESVHRRKDGSEFPVEVVNTYVRFGGKEYVYSFARDITERKRAEETLRESENRTRSIIEAIPVGMHMYRLEPDGRLVFIGANPAADRILGVNNSIFIGKPIEEAFPPLKETEVPKRYREVAASGKTWHDESIDYYEGVIQGAFEVQAFRTAPSNMVAAFEDITERKRAEKALGASQKLLETIIDTAPTCIKLITADGSLQKMNRAGLEMLDAESFDQVQGKCVYPLVSEEHREAFKTMTQEVFKGRSQTLEFKMIGLKGRARWLYTQAISIRNEKGEVVLALATTIDITERKKIEDARMFLVECGTKGDDFFESLARYLAGSLDMDYICIDRLEGDLLTAKTVAVYFDGKFQDNVSYTLHDTPRGEVVGRDVCCFPDGVRHRFPKDAVLQDMKAESYLGVTLWSHAHQPIGLIAVIGRRPLEDPRLAESILKLVAIRAAAELERKRTEEKIRESEQFIRNILDTVDEGFLVIDRDYRLLTANKAYCCQASLPCDEVIGKHCYEVSHKRHRPCFAEGEECASQQVFASGDPRNAAPNPTDHDGHVIYVETKAFPIKDNSGRVTSVIETINNITEKHLLEEERLKTQKLESIGTLAGGIAHDFNNLLQGIFGYISMAKMTLDQREKSLAMLEQAEKALHQSVNLTTQLLTFSKGGKPVKKSLSLLPVIENAA